jgi:hypothetical protein
MQYGLMISILRLFKSNLLQGVKSAYEYQILNFLIKTHG